jgi:hypothetical protein
MLKGYLQKSSFKGVITIEINRWRDLFQDENPQTGGFTISDNAWGSTTTIFRLVQHRLR